jgi:hypothetical protein
MILFVFETSIIAEISPAYKGGNISSNRPTGMKDVAKGESEMDEGKKRSAEAGCKNLMAWKASHPGGHADSGNYRCRYVH